MRKFLFTIFYEYLADVAEGYVADSQLIKEVGNDGFLVFVGYVKSDVFVLGRVDLAGFISPRPLELLDLSER